ncbi:nitroreductase family protein [Geofilum rubicundum]|uniref:Oxygen-insensitive NADPH nitroreductase n=1 Tax=Geofilum rubicundum JCM 15548 TaxID=1236989 RepID=A0A0E9LXG6_9BACT|nr:nitroreductase family protein [Geofilum rubicundum]GAO29555.1 oxygen-insensitive NADPH nitroreductase [Geofilum rubicundum JCM 15548]
MTAFETLNRHRSIRKYTNQPVGEDLLNRILTAGTRASTTGNMQVYSIVVSKDSVRKAALAPAHFNQPSITNAPVVLTFCADFNRFNKWCRQRNAEPGYDNFLSFVTGAIDALLVAQNVCIAAEDEGLGICYFGTTTYNADKIIETLNLPKGVVPVTTVTLGFSDEKPELTDRLPLQAVVHEETYQDYSPEVIDALYREKEGMPLYQGFVKEHNKETLAQVFTDVRYKKADNEHFSKVLLQVLKNQGFFQD